MKVLALDFPGFIGHISIQKGNKRNKKKKNNIISIEMIMEDILYQIYLSKVANFQT